MSHWLFDLGNSRLKLAPLRGTGRAGESEAIGHDGERFEADWQARLPDAIDTAWIASVAAPDLGTRLADELVRRGARVEVVHTRAACDGVRIAYAQPDRLGVDRFLALLAAHALVPRAALVVGVGTALTIDLLDAGGRHHGGRIAPSPALMRAALHARTAALPLDGGAFVEFADDTADALASGCEGAALGLVARSQAHATRVLGTAPALLVHGGGAPALLPRLPDAMHVPSLVLDGLARWALLHR